VRVGPPNSLYSEVPLYDTRQGVPVGGQPKTRRRVVPRAAVWGETGTNLPSRR
jgi:hypothetical protein